MPSLQYSKEMVDIILDDEFVTFRYGRFRRFLVNWHSRPILIVTPLSRGSR